MKKEHLKLILPLVVMLLMAVEVKNPAPGLFSTSLCGQDGCEFKEIISNIIQLVLGFAGLAAMAYIIIGGYQMITAGGNEKSVESGKKTLTNAIIGLVIIISSYIIISIVINAAFGNLGQRLPANRPGGGEIITPAPDIPDDGNINPDNSNPDDTNPDEPPISSP